ncbi:DUF1236 domain-containing protein [Bradyrhizobium sp. CSA207]|uniref:DUF1236 domain-containing protein n=1 Tax=Bradyrhizobium sp. CSA207 TaxID=2698826 RepID=UPI0023B008A0|nr:DUF1236 domain-containing protein [Bradyrhizobium sp. CSA207]MDE5447161.1 DUF1236 domain-containing protein [Bradyrhizobium sp. CSA207]
MRKHLMLSTAAVGLMLASGLAYAQAPGERKDETRRTEEPAKGAAQQRDRGPAQERTQERTKERAPERAQGGQERMQGAGREEKGGGANRQANEEKNRPAAASERNQPNAKEQAKESREPARDRNRETESAKQGRESGKSESGRSSAETKQDKSAPQKSTAESEKSKAGTAGQQKDRAGTAASQNERNQSQPPRNAAEQQPPAQQGNRPATATDTNRTPPSTNAQTAPAQTGTQTNQANQTTQSNTQVDQQTRVTSERQVRISETLSRERLAQPERNLNISIRAGETIPPRVRLYRLPPEIVSIEPEYRDYEYFATDDDVVIVEPRTHRIVSQVPRDPSRARAQMGGGATSSMAAAGGSNVNCRVMRRDASGNVAEAEPSTVGSTARTDSLSVTVQLPGGGSSAPIALGAATGDIVVATQGQGDCTVTIEPQTR